jgi:hypothetical protein
LNRFAEAEIPVLEPLPKEEQKQEQETSDYTWDHEKDYWAHWSLGFGEKIARSLFGQKEGNENNPGINMKLAKGDLLLEETEADTCIIRAANGEVTLNNGRISKLDLKLMKGNIESESCKPGDDWTIRTNRGNIFISLTGDVVARLDVATRHGDIQSKVPLVRVTRQGPEVWRGGRMVGTVGINPQNKEKIPELNMSTLRGDIKIETQSGAGQQEEKPESPPVPPPPPSPPTKPPAGKKADLYKTQMDILQALREGRINVDEAERLLDNLESRDSAPEIQGFLKNT